MSKIIFFDVVRYIKFTADTIHTCSITNRGGGKLSKRPPAFVNRAEFGTLPA